MIWEDSNQFFRYAPEKKSEVISAYRSKNMRNKTMCSKINIPYTNVFTVFGKVRVTRKGVRNYK